MRNSIIIIALAFIAIFTTTNVVAQNGKTSVSIGAGQFFNNELSTTSTASFFGTSTTRQTSRFSPMASVKVERRLGKYFSIGLDYSKLSASTEEVTNSSGFSFLFSSVGPSTKTDKIESKISGTTLNLKGVAYSDSSFHAYIGLGFGGLKTVNDINSTTIGDNSSRENFSERKTENSVTVLAELNVGLRYFVTKNVGLYGELGLTTVNGVSGAAGQVGAICRF
jgi:Outer membrane protein beta-barrel domain